MSDRGAIESIAEELCGDPKYHGREHITEAQQILDRLAADGYSVVKTGPTEALYEELCISAGIDQAFLNGYRHCLMEIVPSYRPAKSPDAQAVLEASEDEQ